MTNANETTVRPFKKLDAVYVAVLNRPGCPYLMGEQVTVTSVVNEGTKRNPVWRYLVAGWSFYQDQVSATDPLAGMR